MSSPALGESPEGFRSGFVCIVGRPNVGKSTLTNKILGQKVSIVSQRPQTTRNAVRGVLTTPGLQIVLVDTPGLHKPRTVLGSKLNDVVRNTWREVDAVVFVCDASQGVGRGDAFLAAELARLDTPVVVALNKADLVDAAQIRRQREAASELGSWAAVLDVSALSGDGLAELVGVLRELLPAGPMWYPGDMVTDQPERWLIAEMIREKALELVREEVPHSVAVTVEDVQGDADQIEIDARIYVEHQSQKGILIGTKGQMLRTIGTRARKDIETLLGSHVYLRLMVKVEPNWQKRASMVRRFGYGG